MSFIVYEHLFPNGKSYVGITCQKQNRRWRNGKGYYCNIRMSNAIKKYGWDNIQHIILAKDLTIDQAELLERQIIREKDLTNPDKGYNYAIGGIHPPHTEETKRKIAEKAKGRKHSDDFKKWISANNSGANNFMYGKHHSEETKKKISEAKKGSASPNKGKYRSLNPYSKQVASVDTQTGEIIAIYPCIKDAAESINRSLSCLQAALHGQQKTCNGTKWVYL